METKEMWGQILLSKSGPKDVTIGDVIHLHLNRNIKWIISFFQQLYYSLVKIMQNWEKYSNAYKNVIQIERMNGISNTVTRGCLSSSKTYLNHIDNKALIEFSREENIKFISHVDIFFFKKWINCTRVNYYWWCSSHTDWDIEIN